MKNMLAQCSETSARGIAKSPRERKSMELKTMPLLPPSTAVPAARTLHIADMACPACL